MASQALSKVVLANVGRIALLIALGLVLETVACRRRDVPDSVSMGDARQNPGAELRARALTSSPEALGVGRDERFPQVYGVVMDWPLGEDTVTLVSLSTGDASLYTTASFGVIGGEMHETVREAARAFVERAHPYFANARRSEGIGYPRYPRAGHVRFYLLGWEEVRVVESHVDAVESGRDPRAPLWRDAQEVIALLREAADEGRAD